MTDTTPFRSAEFASPIGVLALIAGDRGLRAVLWPGPDLRRAAIEEQIAARIVEGHDRVLAEAIRQLGEYFDRRRTKFDLPTDAVGTEFQRRAWRALAEIPYGQTRTYGEQATMMGSPTAVRAVGAANGRNPLPIVVPCHRVIGSSGNLTGFAGGLESKRFLLDLESDRARLSGGVVEGRAPR